MTTLATGLATSFITFSRPGASGGGATVTDRDGKIKWAGHNLLLASESFDSSSWSRSGMTGVTANSTAALNGTTTADTAVESNTLADHWLSQTASMPAGSTVTLSIFVKRGSGTRNLYLRCLAQGGSDLIAAYYNLGTGAVGSTVNGGTGVISSTTITDAGSGWYLCTLSGVFSTSNALSSVAIGIANGTTNGSHYFTGDGTSSLILWGAHLYRSDLGGMQLNPSMPAGMQSYYPTTPRNLLGYTEDFNSWSKTLTTVTSNAIVAPNGLQTADKLIAANSAGVEGYISLSPNLTNSKETLSCYMKAGEWGYGAFHVRDATNGFTAVYFNLLTGVVASAGAGWTNTGMQSVGNGWYRCYGTKERALSQAVVIAPSINGTNFTTAGDGTSGIYLWGAQLSDSASLDTYVPQYGAAVTSAAYYAPRLDFDPVTLAAKGLLVEELRTNLLLNSAAFNSWSASNATVDPNVSTITAPDGTTTAERITAGTSSGYVYNAASVTSGTAYTYSVYLRADNLRYVSLVFAGGGWTGGNFANFDLQTGTVVSVESGITAPAPVSVGNGWYRVSATKTASSTATADLRIQVSPSAWVSGTADKWFAYGAQLEAGSFATSYIPNGSAVAGATRAADVASVSTGAFPYSGTEGTWVLNFSRNATGGNNWVIGLTGSNTYDIVAGNTNVNFRYGATGDINAISTNVVGSSGGKVAGAYTANGTHAISVNGTAVVTTGTSTDPGTTGTVRIGVDGSQSGNTFLNGHIRQITYLPRRLTNAELQSRTA